MAQRGTESIRLTAAVFEAIRSAIAQRPAPSPVPAPAPAGAAGPRVSVRGWRSIDYVAILLVVGIIAATLGTDRHEVAGTPFLWAIPTWLIARRRGSIPGIVVATALVIATWIGWQDATLVARINVSFIVLLGLLAGLDGRRRIAAQAATVDTARARDAQRRSKLTKREHDVLALLGTGHTNKEVAAQLGLSVRTIESHRSRIVTKLGSSGRADLYRHALELGLLDAGNADSEQSPGD